MLFKRLTMTVDNHNKLDAARLALTNIGSNIKSFATGVVDKIGGGIRSIKEKGWSEIKADTLTKLSSVKNSMLESFGKTVRSVVKRFNPDAGTRMSMNHYADKLKNDLYLPSLNNNDTNIEVSHALDNLCNNKDLTTQEKADILKSINKEMAQENLKGKTTEDLAKHLPNIVKIHVETTQALNAIQTLTPEQKADILTDINKITTREIFKGKSIDLYKMIDVAIEFKKVSTENQSIQQPSSKPIENLSQESSVGPSTLTEEQQNTINSFHESPNQQSSIPQPTKRTPPLLPPRNQTHTQIPTENTSSAVQQSVPPSPNMPSQPPPISQKNETPQLPPKPNGINQQTIQANTKSPEQSHIAPQKQPPSAPSKTASQPTIAQSTNQVPTKSLPQTPQKATLQTSTQSAPQSNEAAMPAKVSSPTQSISSAPQTTTQPAVEENKTAETTSTSHSDTKKTTTSFLKK